MPDSIPLILSKSNEVKLIKLIKFVFNILLIHNTRKHYRSIKLKHDLMKKLCVFSLIGHGCLLFVVVVVVNKLKKRKNCIDMKLGWMSETNQMIIKISCTSNSNFSVSFLNFLSQKIKDIQVWVSDLIN